MMKIMIIALLILKNIYIYNGNTISITTKAVIMSRKLDAGNALVLHSITTHIPGSTSSKATLAKCTSSTAEGYILSNLSHVRCSKHRFYLYLMPSWGRLLNCVIFCDQPRTTGLLRNLSTTFKRHIQ